MLVEEKFKKKFDTIYNGIKLQSFSALCYNAVFTVRRFNIVLINVYFTIDSPLSGFKRTHYLDKIMAYFIVQIIYLSYIHTVRPHDQSIFNNLEFINEYSMLLLAYLMVYFTGVPDILNPQTGLAFEKSETVERWIEYIALAIVAFMTLFNFGVMIKISVKKMMLNSKKKKA